jgi:N-acetyl-1-D-myo-inositol-2-amino-2-deoxy-alpha-D-glucopyranoside deacetylase
MKVTELFAPTERVVLFHAHPDDETLATGPLILALRAAGNPVAVVTATRGEEGEATAAFAALPAASFVAQRECELRRALEDLGVSERAWLGTPPARAAGRAPRRYRDSGMWWASPGVAGPSADAAPDALALAPVAEAAADLEAFLIGFGADVLISYDELGGYQHPDHVACHRIAAAVDGVRFVQVVSPARHGEPGQVVVDAPEQAGRWRTALADYPSQFELLGDQVRHVGGQVQPLTTATVLMPGE